MEKRKQKINKRTSSGIRHNQLQDKQQIRVK